MSSLTPDLVNNEAKPAIIQIRIVNPVGDYEQSFECRWPNYVLICFKERKII